MTTESELIALAGKLSRAQKACILNGSKRPKGWGAIRRHAKIDRHHSRVHGLAKFFDHGPDWREGYFLNALGLRVKDHIRAAAQVSA